MDDFIKLSDEEKRTIYQEANAHLSLPTESIEKDFWVCWTLDKLFSLDGIGNALCFKGGTSLSKAWKLIERFSEDIDIVVNRENLGFVDDKDPESADTITQPKKRIKKLKDACQKRLYLSVRCAPDRRRFRRLPGQPILAQCVLDYIYPCNYSKVWINYKDD